MLESRKTRRAYHRILSGLQVHAGESVRFVTLTSSPQSPRPIRQSWRLLVQWFKRRSIRLDYYAVVELTRKGGEHLHALVSMPRMYQWHLSLLWERIHRARVVDIRLSYSTSKRKANYLVKYLAKGAGETESPSFCAAYDSYVPAPVAIPQLRKLWSCSLTWAYEGACRVWTHAVHIWRQQHAMPWRVLYELWGQHLSSNTTPAAFLRLLYDLMGWRGDQRLFAAALAGNAGFTRTAWRRAGIPLRPYKVGHIWVERQLQLQLTA